MKKIGIGLLAIILIAFVWATFSGDSQTYVKNVGEAVAELETELAALETAVEDGALTPEAAAEAQVRIADRIDSIESYINSASGKQLSASDRAKIVESLQGLKGALVKYRDTLLAVDQAVLELPAADRPQLKRGGGSSRRNLTDKVVEAVATVEDHVTEVVEDFVPEDIDDVLTEIADTVLSTSTMSDVADEMEETMPTEEEGSTDQVEDTAEAPVDDSESVEETDSETEEASGFDDTGSGESDEDFGFVSEDEENTTPNN